MHTMSSADASFAAAPVALTRCGEYDTDKIYSLLLRQFEALGIGEDVFKGKNVVLKPNLVMNKGPEFAATTDPSVVRAAARIAKSMGAGDIVLAESWGGPYTEPLIKKHYRGCGMRDAAQSEGFRLNTSAQFGTMSFPDGVKCRSFSIIQPIIDADVIIDLPKLKTHSLTAMSGAVKNFFDTVPGVQKFEMHARFPEIGDFSQMICDLCQMLCAKKTVIAVCDAVVGMEGNGPTGGTARNFGFILTSASPFNLDAAAAKLLGIDNATTVGCSLKRGLCVPDPKIICAPETTAGDCTVTDIKLPDAQNPAFLKKLPTFMGGRAARFFQPRPKINSRTCIGCGKCRDSCPVHTITVKETRRGRKAAIDKNRCIRCFCCQELCPINSVKIVKNPIIKLVH